MAKQLSRKKVVFAAIESTYGTDATPQTTPANAVQTKNLSITPIEGDELQRNIDGGGLGAMPTVLAGKYVMIEFDVDAAGSGAAGTAPAYGPLIQGCGFAETVNTGISVEYDPISSNFPALSLYTFLDRTLHKLLGARGSISFKGDMKGFADFHFKFMGLFMPISEATSPQRDYSSYIEPVSTSSANDELTVHGTAVPAAAYNWDMGGNLVHHETTAGEEILLTDRQVSGSFTMEAPDASGFPVWDRAQDKQTGAMLYAHGTSAGNIIEISAPALEVGKPSYTDQNGVAMVQTPFVLLPTSTGDDDIKITIK